MARLGDVFTLIRNGASIKQSDGLGGFPITRIETISDKTVDRNKFGYAGITDLQKYQAYILQDGDILMSHINSEGCVRRNCCLLEFLLERDIITFEGHKGEL